MYVIKFQDTDHFETVDIFIHYREYFMKTISIYNLF